jgi:pimeloyl-ACP methyl ester carboxylesterase
VCSSDLFGNLLQQGDSALNWLRGFQELHAHSVKHLLHSVEHPTLLLSGQLDYLTPSWVMDSMAKSMPNAVHRKDWFSSHFSIIENADFIVNEVSTFLKDRPNKYTRCGSMHFEEITPNAQDSCEQ